MLRVVRRSQAVGRTVVDVGGAEKVDAALREIAGDAFGIWSLRALLNEDPASGAARGDDVESVVRRAGEGVRDGRYVFVHRDGKNAPLPPPVPPPVVDAPAAPTKRRDEASQLSWVAIELVDENGKPVAGEPYEIVLPDGRTQTGHLNDQGEVTIQAIREGACKLTFPNLDTKAWEPA